MDDVFETGSDLGTAPSAVGRSVLGAFCYWYVVVAPRNIIAIWRDYLMANLNYFSIAFLLRTLVAPWHRDTETYAGGFDIALYARVIIVNTVSRIVGFLIRSTTILIGLAAEAGILGTGLLALALWFLAPFLILFGLAHAPTAHFSVPQFPTFPTVPLLNFAPPAHGIR